MLTKMGACKIDAYIECINMVFWQGEAFSNGAYSVGKVKVKKLPAKQKTAQIIYTLNFIKMPGYDLISSWIRLILCLPEKETMEDALLNASRILEVPESQES